MGCGVSNNGVCMLLCVHLKSTKCDILNEPPEKTINEYLLKKCAECAIAELSM